MSVRIVPVALAFAVLASTACLGIRDLAALQQGLSASLHRTNITVRVNEGTTLEVQFTNDAAAPLPDSARAAFARSAAEFVRDNYPSYWHLDRVDVVFTTVTGSAGVTVTQSDPPYRFATRDLGVRVVPPRAPTP